MKKVTILFIVFISITLIYAQVSVPPAVGSGTDADPYQIATLENLYWIAAPDSIVPSPDRAVRWSSHYIQTDDIDASPTQSWFPDGQGGFQGWIPVGYDYYNYFSGYYNGNNYTISGLYINRPNTTYIGLFGYVWDGFIEYVGVINVNILGNDRIGSLAGYIISTDIHNCYSTGNLSSYGYGWGTGGLVGQAGLSSFIDCYNTVDVNGSQWTGGLIGKASSVEIINCYNSGHIVGSNHTGGLVGDESGGGSQASSLIENSYNTGIVYGSNTYVGGLFGISISSLITNCYNLANISGHLIVGGLVGAAGGPGSSISNSYNSGNVNGSQVVGGLGGQISVYVENSFNAGNVNGNYHYLGGLVGGSSSNANILNCYNIGNVTGNVNHSEYVGGLLGYASGSIMSNSYNNGFVAGNDFTGGIVGDVEYGASITNSYWDIETSGQLTSAGGIGRTTNEMTYPHASNTYVGWDFNQLWAEDLTYDLNNGYPVLVWQIDIITVEVPTFSPEPGTYTLPIDVIIETATEDATIMYRTSTDGGTWSEWQTYTEPISIPLDTAMDFEAYAEKPDWITSEIVEASYNLTGTVANPTFSPEPGTYTEALDVIIQTATEDATIMYRTSTNGGAWSEWQTYTEPINISLYTVMDFEAYAEKPGWITSETVEASYIVGEITATAPLFGDGTIGNPYQIATLEDLYWITAPDSVVPTPDRVVRWSSHYIQTDDIDASPTQNWFPDGQGGFQGWLPIGSYTPYIPFSGSYDGDGHTISDLYLKRPMSDIGLFSISSSDSYITNLGLIDVDITAGLSYYSSGAGALVGWCWGYINNCYASGVINGRNKTGGLVGEVHSSGTIINSHTSGTISGGAGGLVGFNRGTITNSYSTADLTSNTSDSKGGFVGSNSGTIDNCYASGFVSGGGNGNAGGFVNHNTGTITNSYATGEVIPFPIRSGGGFAAINEGTISHCYATGNVTSGVAGGFIGTQQSGGTVENCYATGNVTNPYSWFDKYAGGFIGINYTNCSISNCYSMGNVIRDHTLVSAILGGFIGKNHQAIITNSFSTGFVAYNSVANPTDKGFAGGVDTGGNYLMSGNYWDMETSNQTGTAGIAEGRFTFEMTYPYAANTYVDWDFNQLWAEDTTYTINNGYPYLQMQVYVPQPQISVNPENFVVELDAGESIVLPMTISNDGDAELIFTIVINGEVYTITETQVTFSGSNRKKRVNIREEWLTASPLSGAIPAGEDLIIDITFDAELLEPGIYNADIIVANNAQEDVIVPTELTVIDTVAAPTFSPEPGIYTESIDVFIETATEDATIMYRTSTNGGAWSEWQTYTEPISIPLDTAMDFEAYAEKPDWITSEIVEASYIISEITATAPLFGDGTIGNPYQIATLENLYWIAAPDSIVPSPDRAVRWSSHYIQTDDIDASTTQNWFPDGQGAYQGWLPIGKDSPHFSGSYDGDSKTISDLYINRSVYGTSIFGLFGRTNEQSVLNNIGLLDVNITCNANQQSKIGGLVGFCLGTVENCYVTGDIVGVDRTGGLIGELYYNGIISDSYSDGTVSGNSIGGLAGLNRGTILDSYSSSDLYGGGQCGGLVQYNEGTINGSYATGTVTTNAVSSLGGGLVTTNYGTITNSHATGDVNATNSGTDSAGGLVGKNYNFISNSHATGNVTSCTAVGGLVANNSGYNAIIENSYSTGYVVNNYSFWTMTTGGMVGVNSGEIHNSYTRSNVLRNHDYATSYIGGFVGRNNQGIIENSFSTGWVSYYDEPDPTDKGFAGGVDTGGNYLMSGNYWDMETSNQTGTAGIAEGRFTFEMTYPYAANTYVDWDFNQLWAEDTTYTINNGYPYLQMQVYVPQPQISVNPENFVVELDAGESIILPMTISNDGDAELIFTIVINGEVYTIAESIIKISEVKNKTKARSTFREEWLTASPLSGTIPAGEDLLIDITFDAELLEPGIYNADIIVVNNAQEDVMVPTELTVIDIVVAPTFSPEPGIYTESIDVLIETATEDAAIMYRTSTDGGAWSDWETYTEPISIPLDTAMDFEAYAEKPDWITSEIVEASYNVTGTVTNPTFSPEPGIYTESIDVIIETATEDATIMYRTSTDGGAWSDWQTYTEPINIPLDTAMDFEAYAEKPDWITSEIVEASYNLTGTVANPTFSPEPGIYTESIDVSIEVLDDNEILTINRRNPYKIYKRDMDHPDTNREDEIIKYRTSTNGGAWSDWLIYTEPINIPLDTAMDFEAYAEKDDWLTSQTVEASYIVTGTVAAPEFNPEGGVYLEAQTVTITTATAGATIEYSYDGESWIEGDTAEVEYSTMLYARAYLGNWNDSEITEEMYYILNPPQELEAEGLAGYVQLNWQQPTGAGTIILNMRRNIQTKTVDRNSFYRDSENLIGYNVYRLEDGEFILLNPEPITETEYEDSDLEAGEYTYHVTAMYDQGESNPSNTATATVNMVSIPQFSPEPGYYEEAIEMVISCDTEAADIYYSLDGSEPTQESLLYTEPVYLDSTVTVKAKAYKDDWLPSEIAEATYEIDITSADSPIKLSTILHPAYPNPFNPETNISFSLAKAGWVSIEIYNVRGQKVRNLVKSDYDVGYHTVIWNGRDDRDREVGGGVYLYRFQSGDYKNFGRMLLLK